MIRPDDDEATVEAAGAAIGSSDGEAVAEEVDQPGDDAIVIRFRPIAAESLVTSAQKAFRRDGHYRLSVFADAPVDDEDEDAVISRLLLASELSSIDPLNNSRYYLCSSAQAIRANGFQFVKDGYDGEVAEHYSVEFTSEPTLEDAQKFASLFFPRKR